MQSENINELAAALSKAQGKITGALKDSSNPFFKSKYADLASVWDACREQLSANGLAVVQSLSNEADNIIVITTLVHSSGQWMRGSLAVKPVKHDPQGIGSAITYARRYALAAIVGVAQIDDDAEAAMGRKQTEIPKITEQQAADLKALAEEVEADVPKFLEYLGKKGKLSIASFSEIPANMHHDAVAALEQKRKK